MPTLRNYHVKKSCAKEESNTNINSSNLVMKGPRDETPDIPRVSHKKNEGKFDVASTQSFIAKIRTNRKNVNGVIDISKNMHSFNYSANLIPPVSCENPVPVIFSASRKKKLPERQVPPIDFYKEFESQAAGLHYRKRFLRNVGRNLYPEFETSRKSLNRLEPGNRSVDTPLKILNRPKRGAGNLSYLGKSTNSKVKGFENID
jgi:hypothetical protein